MSTAVAVDHSSSNNSTSLPPLSNSTTNLSPSQQQLQQQQQQQQQQKVGPYILGRTLGVGSTGRVKLGTHATTGKTVAIKIINKAALSNTPDLLRKIEREIAIMKLIDHPNVLSLYDVYENSHHLFLVLEHVEGGELFDYLVKKGKLPNEDALRFFRQILSAIDFCHKHCVCHRDLKPENLLLDADRNIKIADFGMASLQVGEKMLETSCGSPHYASPEVIKGIKYDGRAADVWSCGIILFALLTGNLPFDDDNIHRLLNKVKTGEFIMPSYLRPEIKDLISKMLTVDPDKRIKVHEIMQHPWYTQTCVPLPEPVDSHLPAGPLPSIDSLDEDIMFSLRSLGCFDDDASLTMELMSEQHNVEKVIYYLLLERKKRLANFGALEPTDPNEVDWNSIRGDIDIPRRRTDSVGSGGSTPPTYTPLATSAPVPVPTRSNNNNSNSINNNHNNNHNNSSNSHHHSSSAPRSNGTGTPIQIPLPIPTRGDFNPSYNGSASNSTNNSTPTSPISPVFPALSSSAPMAPNSAPSSTPSHRPLTRITTQGTSNIAPPQISPRAYTSVQTSRPTSPLSIPSQGGMPVLTRVHSESKIHTVPPPETSSESDQDDNFPVRHRKMERSKSDNGKHRIRKIDTNNVDSGSSSSLTTSQLFGSAEGESGISTTNRASKRFSSLGGSFKNKFGGSFFSRKRNMSIEKDNSSPPSPALSASPKRSWFGGFFTSLEKDDQHILITPKSFDIVRKETERALQACDIKITSVDEKENTFKCKYEGQIFQKSIKFVTKILDHGDTRSITFTLTNGGVASFKALFDKFEIESKLS